ncbi:MAG: DUF5063 domain-containing protein [Citromicrobium sp.]|nr:DUF5063 domain-containing protein [Citromicrobium sp.]MAO96284.1 DUF5063 domain-containing protein [Citromicrobium sp.]MBT48342.1 DUF5063 domain-containing protein [Citromicrobium sp.]
MEGGPVSGTGGCHLNVAPWRASSLRSRNDEDRGRGGEVSLARSEQTELIKSAIQAYLARLDRDPADGSEGLRRLVLALDALVAVYFRTDDVEPGEEDDAPEKGYSAQYQRAAEAYPELGLYPYADPGGDPGEDEPMVADAIDDIADIAGDLTEVLWHFENSSEETGIWDFRFGYQHHWGDHLHSLRNYLHSSRIAAW